MESVSGIDLSVIVPVYNAERDIEKCIASILASRIDHMEVIVVDDGSRDKSLEVCRRLAEQDSRIKLLSKPNGGCASARNYGLRIAGGNYVSFVDSDDTVISGEYAKAFEELRGKNTDIGCFGIVAEGENLQEINGDRHRSVWSRFVADPIYMHSVCNKFFRQTIIDGLTFDEDLVVCEDMLFCARAFLRAKEVEYIERTAYRYCTSFTSVTHSAELEKKSADDMEAARRLYADSPHLASDVWFNRFIGYRYQIAALRYLIEPEIFSIKKYRECVLDKGCYRYLGKTRHSLLCWCANHKIDVIPALYIFMKKIKIAARS